MKEANYTDDEINKLNEQKNENNIEDLDLEDEQGIIEAANNNNIINNNNIVNKNNIKSTENQQVTSNSYDDDEFNDSYLEDESIMNFIGQGQKYRDAHPTSYVFDKPDPNAHVFDNIDPNIIETREPNRAFLKQLMDDYCRDTSVVDKVEKEKDKIKKKELINSLDRKFVGASSIDKKFEQYFKIQILLSEMSYSGYTFTHKDPEFDMLDKIDNHFFKILKTADTKAVLNVIKKLKTIELTYCDKYKKDLDYAISIVPKADPHLEDKAKLIATSTSESTLMLKTIQGIQSYINNAYNDSQLIQYKLLGEYNITNNMTLEQYAERLGYKGAQKIRFLQDRKETPTTTLTTHLINKIKKSKFAKMVELGQIKIPNADKNDEKELVNSIIATPEKHFPNEYRSIQVSDEELNSKKLSDLIYDITHKPVLDATENYAKKKNRTTKQVEKNYEVVSKALVELNRKNIEDWAGKHGFKPEGGKVPKGKNLVDVLTKSTGFAMIQDNHVKTTKDVNYSNYIIKHTGYKASRNINNSTENLAKSIAAMQQVKSNKKFNLDEIHKIVEIVKQMPSFKVAKTEPVLVTCALTDLHEAEKYCNKFMDKVYGITPNKAAEYINKMETLYNSMKPTGSKSTEYTNFRKSIEDIKNLKTKYNLNTENGKNAASKALTALNLNMINASETYMKGKKSVRSGPEGQRRFNNSLDALGILCSYSADAKVQVQPIVNRINQVRDVKPGHKDFVNIDNFNETRAANARKAIEDQKKTQEEAKKNSKKNIKK